MRAFPAYFSLTSSLTSVTLQKCYYPSLKSIVSMRENSSPGPFILGPIGRVADDLAGEKRFMAAQQAVRADTIPPGTALRRFMDAPLSREAQSGRDQPQGLLSQA